MTAFSQLAIFGAGTLGRLATRYFQETIGRDVATFVVDDVHASPNTSPVERLESQQDTPIIGWSAFLETYPPDQVDLFIAIGYRDFQRRAEVFARCVQAGYQTPSLVCPTAYVAPDAILGRNIFVMPGVVVEAEVMLGDNIVLWSNTTVCHGARVGEHAFIAANTTIGGEARVGRRVFLGFSTTVLEHRRIADDIFVGAGSLVTRDLGVPGVYMGMPARAANDVDYTVRGEVNRTEAPNDREPTPPPVQPRRRSK